MNTVKNLIGKDKIYLVKYSVGSYDDYMENACFATFNYAKALNYVNKGNRIVDMAKKHYLDENGELKEKYKNTFIEDKYFNYCEFNNYYIEEVEFK